MHSITRRKPLSTKLRNVDNFYVLSKKGNTRKNESILEKKFQLKLIK